MPAAPAASVPAAASSSSAGGMPAAPAASVPAAASSSSAGSMPAASMPAASTGAAGSAPGTRRARPSNPGSKAKAKPGPRLRADFHALKPKSLLCKGRGSGRMWQNNWDECLLKCAEIHGHLEDSAHSTMKKVMREKGWKLWTPQPPMDEGPPRWVRAHEHRILCEAMVAWRAMKKATEIEEQECARLRNVLVLGRA